MTTSGAAQSSALPLIAPILFARGMAVIRIFFGIILFANGLAKLEPSLGESISARTTPTSSC